VKWSRWFETVGDLRPRW